jgi:uncharacterized membrane protein YfcA
MAFNLRLRDRRKGLRGSRAIWTPEQRERMLRPKGKTLLVAFGLLVGFITVLFWIGR